MVQKLKHNILRLVAVLPSVALLAIGIVSLFALARDLPAFDRSSRVEGLFGDWRVPVTIGLYDRSEYLFQVGFGYLQGDVTASSVTEERNELASMETALARAASARSALESSAYLAPGNAFTWGFLGWARAMEGDTMGALRALEISWSVAPYNFQLAPARINLLEVLVDIDPGVLSSPEVRSAAARDMSLLQKYDRKYLEVVLEDAPRLRKLVQSSSVDGKP